MELPDDAVAAICRHMDEDHPDDALLICRTLGGTPAATRARTVGVDGSGLVFEADVEGGRVRVPVAFAEPVTSRPQVRAAVVALHDRARAAAGLPARARH